MSGKDRHTAPQMLRDAYAAPTNMTITADVVLLDFGTFTVRARMEDGWNAERVVALLVPKEKRRRRADRKRRRG